MPESLRPLRPRLQMFGLKLTCKLQKQLFGKILAQETDFFDDASVGGPFILYSGVY